MSVQGPDPRAASGYYVFVGNGSLVHGGEELPLWSMVVVENTEKEFEIRAGDKGVEALVLQYPREGVEAADNRTETERAAVADRGALSPGFGAHVAIAYLARTPQALAYSDLASHPYMNKFKYLFEPRSIAVVGVSDDAARPGSQAVRALLKYGYAGKIFPVNPKYKEFEGLKCYASVADIDDDRSRRHRRSGAGRAAGAGNVRGKQVPFAVILSGGFRESGPEGIERERRMLEIAREAGMRIIGPNCLGFANIHSNVYAAFGSITREPKLKPGPVSLVTQSGGFGYSIALACAEAGIGFRHVIATGNESDVDTVELIDALLDDDETHIIVAYIEGTKTAGRCSTSAAARWPPASRCCCGRAASPSRARARRHRTRPA